MAANEKAPISYNLDGAAEAAGVSRKTIERAIRAGDLVAHYPTSRPLILPEDLRRWVTSAPIERPV